MSKMRCCMFKVAWLRFSVAFLLCTVAVLSPLASEAAVRKAPVKRVQKAKPAPKKAVVKRSAQPNAAAPVASPYRKTPYVGALAMDAKTGRILFAERADAIARPASVTKLMTALLVLEDVKAGRYGLDSMVPAGPMALRMEPSIIGFQDLTTKKPVSWSVDTLLYALMIRSANDAAVALAEHSSGSMESFVARMNAKAKSLGMDKTVYYNPN